MKKLIWKHSINLIIKILLLIGFSLGLYYTLESSAFMSTSTFLYYTIQSNIWIAAITFVSLFFDVFSIIKKRDINLPYIIYLIKFIATVAITITFTVFFCLLAPSMIQQGQGAYLSTASNLFPHLIVPILALFDFFYSDKTSSMKRFDFFWGISTPLYYLAFANICYASNITFGGNLKFPYYFLDFETNGWFTITSKTIGVFYWIIILLIYVTLLSLLIFSIKNKINKNAIKCVKI